MNLNQAIDKVKKAQKMKGGGLSGGNPSGKPKRMVPDPAEELNPGKSVDVTEMAMGGYMDDEVAEKMMGGYMKYEDK